MANVALFTNRAGFTTACTTPGHQEGTQPPSRAAELEDFPWASFPQLKCVPPQSLINFISKGALYYSNKCVHFYFSLFTPRLTQPHASSSLTCEPVSKFPEMHPSFSGKHGQLSGKKRCSYTFLLFLILANLFGAVISEEVKVSNSMSINCEPFDGRRSRCGSEIPIDEEKTVVISRTADIGRGCKKCVTKVRAHEASHYLAVEVKSVSVPEVNTEEKFRQCHTCLCGVLSIYDGEYLIGEWCYGRFTSKYLTSYGRSLSFVYKAETDVSKPNATFRVTVKPVPESRTKIIEVGQDEKGIVSGSVSSQGFPKGAYLMAPHGLQIWLFVNRRPNTTLRLKVNDIFLRPSEIIGFCNNDFVNIFNGAPQVSGTWHSMMCDRNFAEDDYFTSPIVSIVFSPTGFGSVGNYANGFNISYTFFNRNVTGHKHLDCGEFNNSDHAVGEGFMLPPGQQSSQGGMGVSEVETRRVDPHGATSPAGNMNADLRCHWRVIAPKPYEKFIITVTNFTVSPLSNTGETMRQLESDVLPSPNSPEWSISLKEPVGLKLFDGIFSTSQVLTEHAATDSIQPGNKPAFYVTSSHEVRIDVSYPTTTVGTIGFAYAAIRVLESPTDTCDPYNEFKCGSLQAGERTVGGNIAKFSIGEYCIRSELVCDGFPNCVKGEDEDDTGLLNCSSHSKPGWKPRMESGEESGLNALTVTLIVVLAVMVLFLVIVAVILLVNKSNQSERGLCGVGAGRRESPTEFASGNPTQQRSNGSYNSSSTSAITHDNGVSRRGTVSENQSSSGGRSSRHSSGDNPSSQATPQFVEHDPHVTPQPIYIAKMHQQPPLYDLLYHGRRLASVDEEAELGPSTQSEDDDRAFLLLQDSGKGASADSRS